MIARVCMVLLAAAPAVYAAQPNLVNNPGFEESANAKGEPGGGWWFYQGRGQTEVKVDTTVARRGKASARLHSAEEAKGVLVSRAFPIAPADELAFGAWVRTEGAGAEGSNIFAGLAFRSADGSVSERAYFRSEAAGTNWTVITGRAYAPVAAVSAEVHLGYTNAPATIWFDDIAAVITSPVSLSVLEPARPFAGEQELKLRVTNHQTNVFKGQVLVAVGRRTNSVPAVLEPQEQKDFSVPFTLPAPGPYSVYTELVDERGTAARVVPQGLRVPAEVVMYPACPCYHAAGEGNGETRVDASVNLSPARRRGLKVRFELKSRNGGNTDSQPLQTAVVNVSETQAAGANFRVPVQAPGAFIVSATLIDPQGKTAGSAETDVHVIQRGQAQVEVGKDGFLRVAGKPEFPLGLYSSGAYDEMGKAGFSATHSYSITTGEADEPINRTDAQVKVLLDRSLTNGMRMMVELPRRAVEKAQWAQVRRRVETFRHHPGLLCWGSEERVARGEAPLTNIAALYRLVHELDPDHPFVLGDTRDVVTKLQKDRREFFPDSCMDIGIWWWYPIPLKQGAGNDLEGSTAGDLLQPPSWLTTTASKKPLWIAIQAYQKPFQGARYPTPYEYRCMSYLSIINGAKGLFFYTGSGQRDYQGRPAGLLNKTEESHWAYVKELVWELRSLSPVVMARPASAKVEMAPGDAPVEFTTREREGKLYLIAANKSEAARSVEFKSTEFANKKPELLYEARRLQLEDTSLKLEFRPFGVHVIQFEPSGP